MKAALAPVVVVMMADLSDDLPKVEHLVSLVEGGAAVACASRYAPGGEAARRTAAQRADEPRRGTPPPPALGLPTRDPTNSFKAYSRAFLERTPIESRAGFSLALELTGKAHLAGERVAEVPATWLDRRGGASKFRLLRWLPGYLFFLLGAAGPAVAAQRPSIPRRRRRRRAAASPRARPAASLALAAAVCWR